MPFQLTVAVLLPFAAGAPLNEQLYAGVMELLCRTVCEFPPVIVQEPLGSLYLGSRSGARPGRILIALGGL